MDDQAKEPLLSSAENSDLPQSKTSSDQHQSSSKATPNPAKHIATSVQVWHPSADTRPPPRPELGDEYFVPTASEAQKAFSGQVNARERITDGPLLTKSLREREQNQKRNEKYARFPLTRIRIRFSDRTMLEGTLSSNCTISDVYKFVAESLTEQVRSKKFVLYQTPPRREFIESDLKIKNASLLDLQLAPSSLLYIKFTEEILNQPSRRPDILPALLKQARELPPPPSFDNAPSAGSSESATKGGQTMADVLKSGAKVPKWLQNLKKK